MKRKLLLLSVLFSIGTPLASAQMLTYTHSGTGSGSIGGTNFSSANFIITMQVDGVNLQTSPGYYIDHTSVSIDITGVGSYTFITPTRTFVTSGGLVGFSRAGASGLDLFNGPSGSALAGWGMLTPVGPVVGNGGLLQWSNSPVDTSGGVLDFVSGTSTATFTAGGAGPPGVAYCFGDGSGASCPCSNMGAIGEGCANSSGTGATLSGSGSVSIAFDTLQLQVDGVPGDKPGVILRGDTQVAMPAGAGILCASGNVQISQVQFTSAGSATFNNFNGSAFGSVANMGAPTQFQYWYRDPGSACTSSGFNYSNGYSVTYLP